MPSVRIPIDNTDITVSRSVAESVMKQLMFNTDMPPIEDIVYIPRGGQNAMRQMNKDGEPLRLEVENHVQVDYKELRNSDLIKDLTKDKFEYPPIFYAPELGVRVFPSYTNVQLELTVTYKSKSYNDLMKWSNSFQYQAQQSDQSFYHDITYNYTVPADVLAYLAQVYQLTESVAPYGHTLAQFVNAHFAKKGIIVRENMLGTIHDVAVYIKNDGVLGQYTQLPEDIDTTKEPPQSTVTFTYVLSYARVSSLILEYQLFIHNQVVDLLHIQKYGDRRLHQDPFGGTPTFTSVVNTVTHDPARLLDYPASYSQLSDGYRPDPEPTVTRELVFTPIQLDLTNLYSILDLNALTALGVPTNIVALMNQYKANLTTLYSWAIYLEVFEVNATTGMIPITVDANFHLMSTIELNPRNRYYLRMSYPANMLLVDLSMMQKSPADLLALLQYLNSNVTLTTIGDGSYVTTPSLFAAKNLISNTDYRINHPKATQRADLIVRRM